MKVEIVPSVASHVPLMAAAMRDADAREATYLGVAPHRLLWRSFRTAVMRKTAFVDGRIAAMWGVCGILFGRQGAPWLVTADACEDVSPLTFARIYRREAAEMLRAFPSLENQVDASNKGAIRMLQIAGFSIGAKSYVGLNCMPFLQFVMKS